MTLSRIVYRELWEKRAESWAGLLAILLGIAIMVGTQAVVVSSKTRITDQVHQLGANMLILPVDARTGDYYTADFGQETMPEDHVNILHTSQFADKVHEMIPKLSMKMLLGDHRVILTGILPKDEFERKPAWRHQEAFFLNPAGFASDERSIQSEVLSLDRDEPAEVPTLSYQQQTKRKAFDSLGLREVILGREAAELLNLREGQGITIMDRRFSVSQVLEPTGTVDDVRMFAHLHTVQDMTGKGRVINAVEVVGCACTKDLAALGRDIEAILPGTQVITIRDIAQAQSNTIKLMKQTAWIVTMIVMLIGGAGIANVMFAAVHERRREIGTLLSLGATPRLILALFLQKAVLLGLTGAALGYLIGTGLALGLGRWLLHVEVAPQAMSLGWSVVLALVVSVGCSWIPARHAAGLDPAVILQEE